MKEAGGCQPVTSLNPLALIAALPGPLKQEGSEVICASGLVSPPCHVGIGILKAPPLAAAL